MIKACHYSLIEFISSSNLEHSLSAQMKSQSPSMDEFLNSRATSDSLDLNQGFIIPSTSAMPFSQMQYHSPSVNESSSGRLTLRHLSTRPTPYNRHTQVSHHSSNQLLNQPLNTAPTSTGQSAYFTSTDQGFGSTPSSIDNSVMIPLDLSPMPQEQYSPIHRPSIAKFVRQLLEIRRKTGRNFGIWLAKLKSCNLPTYFQICKTKNDGKRLRFSNIYDLSLTCQLNDEIIALLALGSSTLR